MDEQAIDGINNIEYSSMKAVLFLAIRRQFTEMINESMVNLESYLNVTGI